MAYDDALKDYTRFDFTDPQGRWTRPVYRRSEERRVIPVNMGTPYRGDKGTAVSPGTAGSPGTAESPAAAG